MKKYIFSLFAMLLLLASCDYNDKNFEGYDDIVITDVVQFEGEYTGKYPSEGYFTDKTALQKEVNTMLKGLYPYSDKGSTAKVSVLFGDIIEGFKSADVSYILVKEDYDAMGTENGQPGKYDNFDANMDIDNYLIVFCTSKYEGLEVGKTVAITYKFYAGSTTNQVRTYQKTEEGWKKVELDSFVADKNYTLAVADYDAMGTENGQPGRYDNFDANMDVDFYLSIFLKQKFAYTKEGSTCQVTYKFYANKVTTDKTAFYKYVGGTWMAFDPYKDEVEITQKTAEMSFDGSNWVLKRLMGGSQRITLEANDYKLLYNWVATNKPEYKHTSNQTDEFYYGASTNYNNINNNYNTWKTYYNINKQYDGKSNDEIQLIMDERLAQGISDLVLPAHVSTPDPGLSYIVVYTVYGGRGNGNYSMSFIYNQDTQKFEKVSDPVVAK